MDMHHVSFSFARNRHLECKPHHPFPLQIACSLCSRHSGLCRNKAAELAPTGAGKEFCGEWNGCHDCIGQPYGQLWPECMDEGKYHYQRKCSEIEQARQTCPAGKAPYWRKPTGHALPPPAHCRAGAVNWHTCLSTPVPGCRPSLLPSAGSAFRWPCRP